MWIYVVYDNPSDYPGKFVVRRQTPINGIVVAENKPMIIASTLEEARAAIPRDLMRFPRDPSDDPVIVESWL